MRSRSGSLSASFNGASDAGSASSVAASSSQVAGGVPLKDALNMPERDLILKVLAEVRWNRSEAAKRLGIHRSALYHKIRKLGIDTSSQ